MVTEKRNRILQTLKSLNFDLLVIGGGITGAGIAWDAALRKLKVALVEKGDFASGSSSRSSKLIHAGLRYVTQGEFRLVHEGSAERRYLLKKAPHHVTPLPFIVPSYEDEKIKKWKIRLLLTLYDILAGFRNYRRHRRVSKKFLLENVPGMKKENLIGGYIYYDAKMDDARLTLQILRAAEDAGATLLNYAEVIEFIKEDGEIHGTKIVDRTTGDQFDIQSKLVIVATGPWTDKILELDDSHHQSIVRPTKGIHIITPRFMPPCEKYGDIGMVTIGPDGRFAFIIPWNEYTIVGTTDTDFTESPDEVYPTKEDIEYLVATANRFIPNAISYKDVFSAYAGVRPLVSPLDKEGASESDVSRTHEIGETDSGLIFIIGGKYTTFRVMAKEIVDKVVQKLGKNRRKYRCRTKQEDLAPQDNFYSLTSRLGLSEDLVNRIARDYGRKACEFLQLAQKIENGFDRLDSSLYIKADIHYSILEEQMHHLSDFMLRRTQLFMRPKQGLDLVSTIISEMKSYTSWTSEEIIKEEQDFQKELGIIFNSD
ncbi:MAG: glycerol-3-phosphate dehydrogenase/oxidase [Promethearchaeota archaeon]